MATNPQLTKVATLPTKGYDMPKEPVTDVKPKNPDTGTDTKAAGTQIVHWRDKMKAVVKVSQEAEKPEGGFLSFKGGRLGFDGELLPGDKLNCVIIDYRADYEFYDTKYDPKVQKSPVCYAITPADAIVTPWRKDDAGEWFTNAEKPQVEAGQECKDCAMFEFASDLFGGKGKACKTSRRIHLIAADDARSPDSIAKASVLTAIPPATSVENFKLVINQIGKVLGSPYFGAVVEMSVKPHDKYLYQVHFKVLEQITDDALLEALTMKHIKQSERVIDYVKNSEREQGGDPRAQSGKY